MFHVKTRQETLNPCLLLASGGPEFFGEYVCPQWILSHCRIEEKGKLILCLVNLQTNERLLLEITHKNGGKRVRRANDGRPHKTNGR